MKKRYEFSLQYPKPLQEEDLAELMAIGKSGQFSRYSSKYVEEVEQELAAYYDVQHAITCTSGTAALHGCLVALDLPPESEVIVTSIADIGVIIPLLYENLVPVFGDVHPETYNIDVQSVEKNITKATKAVIAVHLAGNPADLGALRHLCQKHGLMLLEDFSQAHGALWEEKKIGSWGDISYGSFQQSKQITCGEGGVITTDNKDLARRAFIGVDKAWQRDLPLEKRIYEFLAPNVRFNAVQAAILRPQIQRLDSLIKQKQERAALLYRMLEPYYDVVKPQKILEHASHAYYSFPLYVGSESKRNALLELLDNKYDVRCAYGYANPEVLYRCVNALKDPQRFGRGLAYSRRSYPMGTCQQAEALLTRSFLIPFNENFSMAEMEDIGARVIAGVEETQGGHS